MRRSAIARPLVSVASVRVSLTVRMKQRTACGPRALCSAWLIGLHCTAGACYDSRMPADSMAREHTNTRTRCRHAVRALLAFVAACAVGVLVGAPRDPFTLDRAGERWVEQTMKKLTLDEKIGQLIV